MRSSITIRSLSLLGCACFAMTCMAADWRQFRGTDNNSVAGDVQLPLSWSDTENVAWKVPLPARGVSSPIVVGNNVIVTSSSGFKQDRLCVSCYDAKTGAQRWQREFWATGRTLCHPTSSNAAPTPASDGERIFAFFSSNDLICLDLDGNLLWLRGLTYDFPTAANDVGMASSPVVADGTVVVQMECEGNSFAAGINALTGETRWQSPRPAEQNWTSPIVWRGGNAGQDLVLLQSGDRLTAHDPMSGEVVWEYAADCAGIASSLAIGDTVYVPAGGMTALKFPEPGKPEAVWQENKLSSGNASAVVHDGKLYVLNSAGALTCGDASTGAVVWRGRLKGSFWATPVLAGNHLYCVNQEGLAQVLDLGAEGKIIAEISFGEPVMGTPAVAHNALYVRTDGKLWKIEKSGQ
ncbi:MAG: PQQ-binding-like beta-propeller repeat protein [Planctomycetia bacterium]|nr:PQQ-binding-like beta-propeller repeat protein [Planctomycetia bacterium]